MIIKEELDQASDLISYRMLDVLLDWMEKEKINLDHFIDNPEGHVNYNPYMIIDIPALQQRSGMLGQVIELLTEMTQYKQGNTNYTKAQYDYAQDHIPIVIFQRLYDWMVKRSEEMQAFLNDTSSLAPINDYKGLYTFDTAKFTDELDMYLTSIQGLGTVIQYKIENNQQ